MQELTLTQMEQVNGAGGGVRIGSDGANNLAGQATQLLGGIRVDTDPQGGRVDPGGANN